MNGIWLIVDFMSRDYNAIITGSVGSADSPRRIVRFRDVGTYEHCVCKCNGSYDKHFTPSPRFHRCRTSQAIWQFSRYIYYL